jgi:hypothetical protein
LAERANTQRRPFSALPIIVIPKRKQAHGNRVHSHMVPQKPEHGIVNQHSGCLYFDIPEGVAHEAHHDPEIYKEPFVLLGLNVSG